MGALPAHRPVREPVEGTRAFLRDLQGAGRWVATARSCGMDMLRWFRFLWAVEVPTDLRRRTIVGTPRIRQSQQVRSFLRLRLAVGRTSVRPTRRSATSQKGPASTSARAWVPGYAADRASPFQTPTARCLPQISASRHGPRSVRPGASEDVAPPPSWNAGCRTGPAHRARTSAPGRARRGREFGAEGCCPAGPNRGTPSCVSPIRTPTCTTRAAGC